MREETLGGEGFNKTNVWNEHMHVCYKFPCCIESDVETSCKVPHVRATFKQLHIVVVDHERRHYLMRKYEDLNDFNISTQDGLCCDIDLYVERVEWDHNVRTYKHYTSDNKK